MSNTYVTTDPRTAGLAGTVGDLVLLVRAGQAVPLVKYGAGSTEWVVTFGAGTIVTADPRIDGGLAGALDTQVIYIAAAPGSRTALNDFSATRLIKYGAGDTEWTEWRGTTPIPLPAGTTTGGLIVGSAGEWAVITAGDAATVLTSNGAGTLPTWETPTGGAGSVGPRGFDGEDADEVVFPGPRGATGSTGATGSAGAVGPPGALLVPEDPEEIVFVGARGATGAQGIPGTSGGASSSPPGQVPDDADDALWFPPPTVAQPWFERVMVNPLFSTSTLTGVKTITSGSSFAVYVGRAPKDMITAVVRARVTTAMATITWGEVAIAKGPISTGGNPTLTVVGFTDVSATYNSTGLKSTTVNVSAGQSIRAGDDLWVVIGNAATTAAIVRAQSIADDLQIGIQGSAAQRPSLIVGTPTAFTLEGATVLAAWAALIVT